MLETRDLVKIYKPKKGVPVVALNKISLRFPEKGMVFLLGKSGSGKSTLLNVLGGLDRCNSGEILIKGQSSQTFRQRHFDSYRNTYVGFIFQEYNILDEFSVGANIALALQLQGKKPSTEQVNDILRQVDLEDHGARNPNELSGGQKQRVAIARALVKNPEIIMADEPTGALDSATGRQILTTLKKLSKDKLVIVVSHDREFAEQYGDRIIELADGQVIRDVERQSMELPEEMAQPVYEGDTISVPQGYRFTEEDSRAITAYIQNLLDEGQEAKVQPVSGEQYSFAPTDQTRIPVSRAGYHLIKSRLPLKYAFKLGASGLKHKKFRLVMTILLSCIAFMMFGLADTAASYDYVDTSVSSLSDPQSQVGYAAFEMDRRQEYDFGGGDKEYYFEYSKMSQEDLDLIEEKTGIRPYPVYTFDDMSFDENIAPVENPEEDMYGYYSGGGVLRSRFAGVVAGSEKLMKDLDARMVEGSLPAPGTNEIALSTYLLRTFQERGYRASYDGETMAVSDARDLIGKTLTIGKGTYTVCGIFDTGIDYSRYKSLEEEPSPTESLTDELLRMALQRELDYALNYSLTGLAVVAEDQIRAMAELSGGMDFDISGDLMFRSDGGAASLSSIDSSKVVWLDGKKRTELQDNELVVTEYAYQLAVMEQHGDHRPDLDFSVQYGKENPDYSAIEKLFLYMNAYGNHGQWLDIGEMHLVGIIPQGDQGSFDDYMNDPAAFGQAYYFSDDVLTQMGVIVSDDQPIPVAQTIAAMPQDAEQIRILAQFSDEEFDRGDGKVVQFNLQNPVSFQLSNLDEVFEVLSSVFLWVGVVFVVFASLLFSNFIATSVSYKKREIGILRAIGSRSNDVFRIFFAESFIIAMINFALSLAGTIGISAIVNSYIRNSAGLLLTVLNVGPRQILLLLGICLAVATIASFLPVRRIAAKRPIDAIRDR